jgi:hypothetical protein
MGVDVNQLETRIQKRLEEIYAQRPDLLDDENAVIDIVQAEFGAAIWEEVRNEMVRHRIEAAIRLAALVNGG